MKYLFLDIDGVLNSQDYYERRFNDWGYTPPRYSEIDPIKLKLLRKIVKDTDCKVILSSTWRKSKDWVGDLTNNGFGKVEDMIIDRTPSIPREGGVRSMERGYEVDHYVKEHNILKYAILDDDRDFLPEQPLFGTTWETGLTEDIAQQVIKHLNEK